MHITNIRKKTKILSMIAVLVLVAAVGILLYFYLQNKSSEDRGAQYGSSTTTPTDNTPKPDTNPNASNSDGSISGSKDSSSNSNTSPIDNSTPPQVPVGTFVSNHRPNMSGSPAPNSLNSTCRTTPGVRCTIQFSNGSTVHSLPEKVTDNNGNASWDWKLQDIGISTGSWSIKAIATNGTKMSESTDPVRFEVGP